MKVTGEIVALYKKTENYSVLTIKQENGEEVDINCSAYPFGDKFHFMFRLVGTEIDSTSVICWVKKDRKNGGLKLTKIETTDFIESRKKK